MERPFAVPMEKWGRCSLFKPIITTNIENIDYHSFIHVHSYSYIPLQLKVAVPGLLVTTTVGLLVTYFLLGRSQPFIDTPDGTQKLSCHGKAS